MSKIMLPIAELKPALAGLGKVIQKSNTLPVLKTVKVDRTKDGWVTLTCTDLDTFVTVRIEEPASGPPASLLVPYDDLARITKGCSVGEAITLEQSFQNPLVLHYPVGQQSAQITVESLAVEEFPPVPKIKSEPIPLSNAIRISLLEAMDCASTDQTRYILQGACIDVSDKKCHHIVGTDGRHLYSSNSFSLPLAESLIIPAHKFLEWKEFNADGEWQLRLQSGSKEKPGHVQISSRRWRFIHRQIEGNYPNWRQIVRDPSEAKTSIDLDPASTDAALSLIAKMPNHDKVNRTIGVEIKGRHVHLLGKSQASEQWTRFEIESVKTTGRDATVFLNRDFLAKALRFGLTRIEIIDEMSPLRFVRGGRQMIVMPTRPDAAQARHEPKPPAVQPPVESNTNPPPAEAQHERSPMAQTNAPSAQEKPALETALAQLDIVRGDFRNAIAGLNKLAESLKQVQRDQKTADKEVQTARQTLEKLQNVRI